jgi:ribonuclease P protein component
VAFAVGRAVGGSVERNRVRRRLRELLRARTDLPPGLYLMGASAGAADRSFDELRADLDQLIKNVTRTGDKRSPSSGRTGGSA